MSVIYAIKIEVDPNDETTWNEWYTARHMPDLVAQPGFVRATKYKIDSPPGEWSQYLAFYEVESREALEAYLRGEAVTELRADHYARFGTCTRLSRMVLTPTAQVDKPSVDA
jgi:hypothetical protein